MSSILALNKIIGDFVWGWPMLIMLLGTGLFLGIRTKFVVVRKFGYVLKNTLLKMFDKNSGGEGEISAFQAVSTALAATVGTGNIAGVALASRRSRSSILDVAISCTRYVYKVCRSNFGSNIQG